MTMKAQVLTVTDFKARCLELFDRLTNGSLDCIEVTRRGKVVAIIKPPAAAEDEARSVHGSMKGMALVAPGFDLTQPILDDDLEVAEGLPRE
jgi:antitoxin (DNA-binding transcriptional repressor) of toxin-antitoxin stability system